VPASARHAKCGQAAINALIGERFDIVNAKQNGDGLPVPSVENSEPAPKVNGVHKSRTKAAPTLQSPSTSPTKRVTESEELSDIVDAAPPKKKRKASIDADAAFAARLQAEEDKLARPTRGGATRKATVTKKKKTPKKKTSTRVTGSDDSDVNDEDRKKQERNTGFHVSRTTRSPSGV